jgi:hypothetical protein
MAVFLCLHFHLSSSHITGYMILYKHAFTIGDCIGTCGFESSLLLVLILVIMGSLRGSLKGEATPGHIWKMNDI